MRTLSQFFGMTGGVHTYSLANRVGLFALSGLGFPVMATILTWNWPGATDWADIGLFTEYSASRG